MYFCENTGLVSGLSLSSLSPIHIWRHPLGQRQTQQDKRLCLRLLSVRDTPTPHPPTPNPFQPILYLGGCYREGRWLITINRTERESEWGGRAHRPTGPCRPKNQGNGRPLLGERKDSFMAIQSWFPPSDLISLPPPRSLLWGLSLESAGRGQMVDGPHRLYSWTRATTTQSDLAGVNHTSSRPTYEEQEQKVLKPRPPAKNRSTLVAHRKCVPAQ